MRATLLHLDQHFSRRLPHIIILAKMLRLMQEMRSVAGPPLDTPCIPRRLLSPESPPNSSLLPRHCSGLNHPTIQLILQTTIMQTPKCPTYLPCHRQAPSIMYRLRRQRRIRRKSMIQESNIATKHMHIHLIRLLLQVIASIPRHMRILAILRVHTIPTRT